MNGKLILGMLLLVVGFSFAAVPEVIFANNTPANNTFTASSLLNMTEIHGWSFDNESNYFEIDGANYTCNVSADNTSCSLSLWDAFADLETSHTYTVTTWGNFSGNSWQGETRMIIYQGCGFANGDITQYVDMHQGGHAVCLVVNASDIVINGNDKVIYTETGSNGVNMYSIENVTFANFSILGAAITGLDNYESNNTIIDNIDVNGASIGVWADASNNCTIKNSDFVNVSQGIQVDDESNDTLIKWNSFYSSGVGVILEDDSSNTLLYQNDYLNNLYDFYTDNSGGGVLTYIIYQDIYNTTVFSAQDSVTDTYYFDGEYIASFPVNPLGLVTVNHKGVSINQTGASPETIDFLALYWNNGTDSTLFNESTFELWNLENGSYNSYNSTPNTTFNFMTVTDYAPISSELVLVGRSLTTTPPATPGNVSDAEAQLLVSQFTTVAIAFFLLFTIFGVFKLHKYFNFDDIFVPLMVAVLLVILAMGLFM